MIRVFRSSVINAPVTVVWAKIRDFNSLPDWHPAIVESRIENGGAGDRVGSVRAIKLAVGATIRERLLTLDDHRRRCTYAIIEVPLPIENYTATLSLTPITDGNRSYIEWSATLDCPKDQEEMLTGLIGDNTFQAGFDALKQMFGG